MSMDQTCVARIVPLEIGRLDADLSELTGEPGRAILPVPSWLIEHPAGIVIFDTGMHRDLQNNTERLAGVFSSTVVDFPAGEELSARLCAVGYRPADVHIAVISHLHFDHVGGTGELPDARLIVQRSEWEAGHHPRLVEVGIYSPEEFDIGHDVQLIEGSHDVFGDGTVVCIPTPGHTKGHQALRVELDSGPVVLTADCIYFERMLEQMQVPVFAFDRDKQLEAMRHLQAMRNDGCRLLFGHDYEQFHSLPAKGLT
jgi:glyoxylase-like metal-dependent hydrolase (beta-lactamase superfamily II)